MIEVDPTSVECPTCFAWVGWACKGPEYGAHCAGYHPARAKKAEKQPHITRCYHETPQYMPHGGFRAKCSCGWSSDCYAMHSDTERAIEVHLQRVERERFQKLLDRTSIGRGLADIKKRGIDAHLKDLEREMPSHRSKSKKAKVRRG